MHRILYQCSLMFELRPLLLLSWSYVIESNDILALTLAFKDAVNVRTLFQIFYYIGEFILLPDVRDVASKSITNPEKT